MSTPSGEPARPAASPPQAPISGLPDPGVRAPRPGERERPVLLRGGTLVDVAAAATRPGLAVLVRDGRVAAVGPDLAADDASVVDLDGRYLMPGLISLHVHPGMMVGLRMDPDGLSPGRVAHDLQVWLRYGVTTVQAMGSDRDFTWDLQQRQRAGELAGARLFSVGHGFGVQGGVPGFTMDPPGPVRLNEPDAIRGVVRELAERGASGVKIWYDDWYGQSPKMAPTVARTIVAACREYGLTSYAHVYRVDDAKLLLGFGLRVLAHMPRDRVTDQELIDLMLERQAAVIPTLAVPESNVAYVDRPAWVDDPLFARFLPPGSVEYLRDDAVLAGIRANQSSRRFDRIERATENVRRLYQAGVRFGFGTDCGVSNRVIGFYEHRELELLVGAGVQPGDALRMATVGAAEVLGRSDELGQIAPGRRADFLVLRANPLDDVRNVRSIEAVWIDGAQAAGAL